MPDPSVNRKYIILNSAAGTVIDLDGGKPTPRSNVQGWPMDSGNKNQQWTLIKADGTANEHGYTYFFLKNVASDTFLDVVGSSRGNGSKLVCNPKDDRRSDQKWRFWARNSEFPPVYGITNYAAYNKDDYTDKFKVDIPDVNHKPGNQLQMYQENDGPAQKWLLILVPN